MTLSGLTGTDTAPAHGVPPLQPTQPLVLPACEEQRDFCGRVPRFGPALSVSTFRPQALSEGTHSDVPVRDQGSLSDKAVGWLRRAVGARMLS